MRIVVEAIRAEFKGELKHRCTSFWQRAEKPADVAPDVLVPGGVRKEDKSEGERLQALIVGKVQNVEEFLVCMYNLVSRGKVISLNVE